MDQVALEAFRRGHPNFDLRVQMANVTVSRPPRSSQVVQIKSHQGPSAALTSVEAWKIRGNYKADKLTTEHLLQEVSQSQEPALQHRAQNYSRFIGNAIQCAFMLQDISHLVFQARKGREETRNAQNEEHVMNEELLDPTVVFSPRVIDRNLIPTSSTLDAKWLVLVAHYTSFLKWPQPEPAQALPISMMEMMLDCCLAFQILPPVSLRLLKRDHEGLPGCDIGHLDTQYVLFPRREADLLYQTDIERFLLHMAPDVQLSATVSSVDSTPTVYPVWSGKLWLLQQCPMPTSPSTVTVWPTCISASVFYAGPRRSSVKISFGDYTCRTAALT